MTAVAAAIAPPLAHHMLVAALPFFGPMLVIGAVIAVMALRDRHRGDG
jgi:hypothetical protein